MPRRDDIETILLIGSGPIVIGQACEFDYSGTQACKALREEGYRVILVNSNPATIMTDPELADATYVEPLTPRSSTRSSSASGPTRAADDGRPDGAQPGAGAGRAGRAREVRRRADRRQRRGDRKAEDRELFKAAMDQIGLESAALGHRAHAGRGARGRPTIGFPIIIRPRFTLGGTGGGIAYNARSSRRSSRAASRSPDPRVLIERVVLGWKEFELEVMRDNADNFVVDLLHRELRSDGRAHRRLDHRRAGADAHRPRVPAMRDAAIAIIREIGVETGGSNVQFAINPEDGRLIVIEMNPRVSRSSALASKATGFPIAKIAAKLAVGYTLDEIPNDITGRRRPLRADDRLRGHQDPALRLREVPGRRAALTTQMKSVGEAMAIGRTFKEALQKACRSLETGRTARRSTD